MAEQARPSGLIVTDDSGNYYYLRPETLAQAKMPDEDVQKLKSGIAAAAGKTGELSMEDMQSVAGGAVAMAQLHNIPQIQKVAMQPLKSGFPGAGAVASTIMCPW